jgi:Bacterial protein of unknown function (DUF894).
MTDRKKMLSVGYIWLAVCAGGLAILGWLNLLTPSVILGSIFLIGTGFAFNAPVFSAVVPEIVSNEELPSASILSGLQLNISGIIGPALGGLLLVFVGASTVFALNALCLLAVLISIDRGNLRSRNFRWRATSNQLSARFAMSAILTAYGSF